MTDEHPDVLLYPSDTRDLYCDGGALACRLCLISSTLLYLWQRRFICYAIEMTEIFFLNTRCKTRVFQPATITQLPCLCCGPLWRPLRRLYLTIAMDLLDKHSKKAVCHSRRNVLAERAADYRRCPLTAPFINGSTTRCVRYSLFSWGYISFWTARKSTQVELKARVNNQRKHPDYRRYSGRLHRCRGFLQHSDCPHESGALLAATISVRAQL